ncbi:hypothetical protein ES703_43289 [subsurface metagenome]
MDMMPFLAQTETAEEPVVIFAVGLVVIGLLVVVFGLYLGAKAGWTAFMERYGDTIANAVFISIAAVFAFGVVMFIGYIALIFIDAFF